MGMDGECTHERGANEKGFKERLEGGEAFSL